MKKGGSYKKKTKLPGFGSKIVILPYTTMVTGMWTTIVLFMYHNMATVYFAPRPRNK
jgi:hypothetical protein